MASQERISVHNLADLKNTSDDAIPNYLNSLKFKQDHTLADTRLALGYGAFALAAACFGWDYKFGFESTKLYTAVAVAVYALLNAALTYWISFVEKSIVYQATAPDGSKISISTATTKNVPIYNMTISITPKGSSTKPSSIEINRSFTEWFDSAGHFIALPFQTMLATAVPVIGQADPKRVASASNPAAASAIAGTNGVSEQDLLSRTDPAVLDAILAAQQGTTASGADIGANKAKGRKKA
ncbi:microsomal signal peptidase 25 kDa subunit-domain-containing protein [Microdochium bolleyi]|uniref:Signal peptidase complex subunit 2 n=1 Tax=Microdochium bolleyi TaxID=196109 RepID=A0A136J4A7_9PEZI|nr:microsomal signal peptidase 25 kDa subunit-domain-containing protein [Microdochium bolleyi]